MATQSVTDADVVAAMTIYGGSFVEALANAFARADPENFTRLRDAFPEIWNEYADLARRRWPERLPS